ncbi:MAG: putative inorganic carbon transporter subunit DabA, partial [Polyangiales bacterium]
MTSVTSQSFQPMVSATSTPKATPTFAEMLDHAAHLLPQQSPLHMFVHHNTLHAFEHLHFEDAVLEAAARFGTEPYQSEEAFARCLESARIRPSDIDAVAADSTGDTGAPVVAGGPTRHELHSLRLRELFEIPKGPALHWMLEETRTLFRFHDRVPEAARAAILRSAERMSVDLSPVTPAAREEQALELLWTELLAVAPSCAAAPVGLRRRDQILDLCGIDTDHLVHPLLIRVCAAFVDQGVAYWQMPDRDKGLLGVFRSLYGIGAGPSYRWMRGLSDELRRQQSEGWDAERTACWALGELGVPRALWAAYIEDTLLSLPGWAGMIRQLEVRPDTAPVNPPPARLVDYLALQLVLDLQASRVVLRSETGDSERFASPIPHRGDSARARELDLELVYEAFIMAQLAGLGPSEIWGPGPAKRWLEEIRAFDSNERRRLLHLAYERRHRIGVLDGIAGHCRIRRMPASEPTFQAVFCIDDREESLRRHLEEIRPDVQTFGYAGFFGVAMSYQGIEDIRPRPLCPVAV